MDILEEIDQGYSSIGFDTMGPKFIIYQYDRYSAHEATNLNKSRIQLSDNKVTRNHSKRIQIKERMIKY